MTNINCNSQCFFHSTSYLTWESNSFQANGPFLYPLIALQNQRFSAVIVGFKIGTVIWNGWKVQHFFTPIIGNSNYKPIFFLHFLPTFFLKRLLANISWEHTLMKGNFLGVNSVLELIAVLAVPWCDL